MAPAMTTAATATHSHVGTPPAASGSAAAGSAVIALAATVSSVASVGGSSCATRPSTSAGSTRVIGSHAKTSVGSCRTGTK